MKFAASFNVFDDTIELLPYSLKSIRKNVDYISVVYQTVSNFGHRARPDFKKILYQLKDEGLIDKLYQYRPLPFFKPYMHEIRKRNIGLKLSQKTGAAYHLSMDSDEFYLPDAIERAKNILTRGNYDSSFVYMQTLYKLPTQALTPPETYTVPLFYRIRKGFKYTWQTKNMPCVVDPTRGMKPGKFIIFKREQIEMFHMSYVRRDIRKKLVNSSALENYSDRVEKIVDVYMKWEPGNKALLAGKEEVYSDTREVPNYFNISVQDFQ